MSTLRVSRPISLNELDLPHGQGTLAPVSIPTNLLDKKDKKIDSTSNCNSSALTASNGSGISASSRLGVPSKPSLSDDLSTSFQTAILSMIHKGKAVIRSCPDSSDFSSYSVYITGNNQSLKTTEHDTKTPKKEEICLRSYKTNILKLKPSFLNAFEEKVYVYSPTSTKPQKIGKIKRSQNRYLEIRLSDSKGVPTYVIEDDKLSQGAKNSSGMFKWLTCSSAKASKTQGKINLRDVKTGNIVPLGSYRLMEVKSRNHDKTFHTLRYEIEFPVELAEETKILISSSLISEAGKNVFCKYVGL